eukprot:s61_g43.t1
MFIESTATTTFEQDSFMELCARLNARPKDMRCQALLALLALQEASAACFKHVSCTSCIAESNEGGSCLWYQHPDLQGIGTCVAGRPEYSPPLADHQQLAVDAYGTWSMVVPFTGETRHFTVPEIDQVSDDSCYTMRCVQSGMCDPGYLAVKNEPCYSDDVFPDWRTLTCCRQQRNINGYLRGYQAENGIILGKLWFASCCTVCYPGQVIKDCHAYDAGYCEDCPVGRFNLYTYAGSECEPCQPCEAGRVRRRCGPSTQGTCNECEAGKEYKLKGLEGSYTDPCLPCEECPTGHMRVGCGGASPGYCAPCQGGSFFAAPFCRNCFTCFPLERIRHGCGGQQQGVCTECSKGRYEDVSEACLECAQCTEPTSTQLVEGLQLTGAWARIGCGGKASGRCVRMATGLELQDVPRCPSSVDTEALCEGSEIAARWSIQGLSHRQLDATYGDCTVATGLCLSGFFRVKLMQRQVDAFDGVEGRSIMPEAEAAEASSSGGQKDLQSQLAQLVPTYDPGVDSVSVETWSQKIELLLRAWPENKLSELATRIVLNTKGSAFQKLQLHQSELFTGDRKGIERSVSLVGGSFGQVDLEKKFEIAERALYRCVQKADETADSFLARSDNTWTELLGKKMSLAELQAYVILRGSRLAGDDKKRFLVESGAESDGTLKMSKVQAAIRMLGSTFSQDYTYGKKDKNQKTYDHTAFLTEEQDDASDDWHRGSFDEWVDDDYEHLASEDDDAALVVQFENAMLDSLQEDRELSAFFTSC